MQERPRFHPQVRKFPWRRDRLPTPVFLGFPGGSDCKESTCNAGDPALIPRLGRYARDRIGYLLQHSWASLVAQIVKKPPEMQESRVRSLGWEDPLEERMATHSSIHPWRIPVDRGAWWATVHGLQRIKHITMNKASGGYGIPVELFQILKDDAVKVLHSICQPAGVQPQLIQGIRRRDG